jgi:integrase
MASKRLIKTAVEALKPGAEAYFVWDSGKGSLPGFGIKVTPSGARIAVYQYRLRDAGRKANARRITIGAIGPGLSVTHAVELAEGYHSEVLAGADPAREAKAKALSRIDREKLAKEHTFKALADAWIKTKGDLRSLVQIKRILKSHLAELDKRDVLSLTATELEDLIAGVKAQAPHMARQVLLVLRSVLDYGINNKRPAWLTENPTAHIELNVKAPKRERVLSDGEIVKIYQAAEAMAWPFGMAVQLLFLTAARRSEVIGLDFSEVDWDAGLWRLPAERSKNGHSHVIHLSEMAKAVLLKHPRTKDGKLPKSGLAFSTTGKTPISGLSKYKANLDTDSEVEKWRLHDIRRTVATALHEMGFGLQVVEKLLNHVGVSGSGVAGIYNKAEHLPERKRALDDWSAKLNALVKRASKS